MWLKIQKIHMGTTSSPRDHNVATFLCTYLPDVVQVLTNNMYIRFPFIVFCLFVFLQMRAYGVPESFIS